MTVTCNTLSRAVGAAKGAVYQIRLFGRRSLAVLAHAVAMGPLAQHARRAVASGVRFHHGNRPGHFRFEQQGSARERSQSYTCILKTGANLTN